MIFFRGGGGGGDRNEGSWEMALFLFLGPPTSLNPRELFGHIRTQIMVGVRE